MDENNAGVNIVAGHVDEDRANAKNIVAGHVDEDRANVNIVAGWRKPEGKGRNWVRVSDGKTANGLISVVRMTQDEAALRQIHSSAHAHGRVLLSHISKSSHSAAMLRICSCSIGKREAATKQLVALMVYYLKILMMMRIF